MPTFVAKLGDWKAAAAAHAAAAAAAAPEPIPRCAKELKQQLLPEPARIESFSEPESDCEAVSRTSTRLGGGAASKRSSAGGDSAATSVRGYLLAPPSDAELCGNCGGASGEFPLGAAAMEQALWGRKDVLSPTGDTDTSWYQRVSRERRHSCCAAFGCSTAPPPPPLSACRSFCCTHGGEGGGSGSGAGSRSRSPSSDAAVAEDAEAARRRRLMRRVRSVKILFQAASPPPPPRPTSPPHSNPTLADAPVSTLSGALPSKQGDNEGHIGPHLAARDSVPAASTLLEVTRGEMAERAAFLDVLRQARRAAVGGRGPAGASEAVGVRGTAGRHRTVEQDANPAGCDGASPRGDGVEQRLRAALREALQLMAGLEREGVRLLLRADAAAASLAEKTAEVAELARTMELAQSRLLQEQAAVVSLRCAVFFRQRLSTHVGSPKGISHFHFRLISSLASTLFSDARARNPLPSQENAVAPETAAVWARTNRSRCMFLAGRADLKRLESELVAARAAATATTSTTAAAAARTGTTVLQTTYLHYPSNGDGSWQTGDLFRLVRRLCGPPERAAESEVRLLLRCLGLEHHAAALEREEVSTVAEVAALPPNGLAAAGLASLGARTAVLEAARGLAMLVGCARVVRRE